MSEELPNVEVTVIEEMDPPNTGSMNFPISFDNKTTNNTITKSQSKPTIQLHKLESGIMNPKKLQRNRSSILKQAIPGYEEPHHSNKNASVMKSKYFGGDTSGRSRQDNSETPMFSRTVFNPKTVFGDTVQGGFYNASKGPFSQTGTNLRKKTSHSRPGLKMVYHDSVYKLTSPEDMEFGVSGGKKFFDPDSLNGCYRTHYPLSSKIQMTSTLYDMMKHKDKNFNLNSELGSDMNDIDLDEKCENQYLNNMLNMSDDDDPIDHDDKKTIGDKAIRDYYKHYKELGKAVDQNETLKMNGSVYTGMLAHSSKRKLLPNKCGIIKSSGTGKTLNIRNQLLGNEYMGVVAQGLKRIDFEKLDFKNNRMHEKGAKKVLNNLRPSNKTLDLSNNHIGRSCNQLTPLLTNAESKLQILNQNKNFLGDTAASELCHSLLSNKNLKCLHLNDNKQTDRVCDRLSELLFNHDKLSEVYLRWNNITSHGGKKIFNILIKNSVVRVLDMSWNILGESFKTIRTESGFIDELSSFFFENTILLHQDISNNHFTFKQSDKIAKALKKNRTIYGIHFTGNRGYIDSEDFQVCEENQDCDEYHSHHILKEISGVSRQKFNSQCQYESIQLIKNACWICDAWHELEFEWSDKEKAAINNNGDDEDDIPEHGPVFIHFKHEGYQPVWMKPDDDGIINVKLMVPNTRLFFFFTVNYMAITSNDYMSVFQEQPEHVNYEINDKKYMFLLQSINLFETNQDCNEIITPEYKINVETKPRVPRPVYRVHKPIVFETKVERPRWHFKISLFKDYRSDNDDLLKKCFDFDFKMTKMCNFIKDEEDRQAVYDYLLSIYPKMKECYKHCSSFTNVIIFLIKS